MPINSLNQVQLSEILNRHFTPSKEIMTPERLFGRDKYLRQIERAFNSEGRNVFIFGDRGIGKTSVAVTAATLNNFRDEHHIYIPCGECSSFGEELEATGLAIVPLADRMMHSSEGGAVQLGFAGASVSVARPKGPRHNFTRPTSVFQALDILSYVAVRGVGVRLS